MATMISATPSSVYFSHAGQGSFHFGHVAELTTAYCDGGLVMVIGWGRAMMRQVLVHGWIVIRWSPFVLLSLLAFGCGRTVTSQLPSYDPAFAASKAMELYDRNNDGKLAADELSECPALLVGLPRIDRNNDRTITAEEIQARFEALEQQSDIKAIDLLVTSKRRPLGGATVTFTPEPFMGDGLQPYSGTTTEQGRCELIGSQVDLYGLPVGYFKVHVVHEGQRIDAIKGCEVADDSPEGNRIEIAL
jgi:hypothetical protein